MSRFSDRRRDVLWGALAAAFLVGQQVTGKATRDALFLSFHPATRLPLVMMGSAVLAVAAALLVSRLLAARGPRQVMPALVGLHAALLLGEFLLAQTAPGAASVLVYLHMAASGGTLLSGYWSVVNERFDPWTAKQAVGGLTLGASLGGVGGGLLAWAAARAVPMATLLPITAGLSVVALVSLVRFSGAPEATSHPPVTSGTTARTLRSLPYLKLLAFLVALGAVVEGLLDYVLKSRAAALLPPGPDLMAFFAAYHTATGLLALVAQTLLARPALQGLGLAGTVALRPLVVALAATAGVVDPRLWSAVAGRGSHDVLSSSLFRSGYELLFTPLPERDKRSAKQVVDVAFDKLGALLGGATVLLAVRLLESPERALLGLAGGISLVTLALTRSLHRGYVSSLEGALRDGQVRLEPEDVIDSTTRFTLAQTHLPHAGRAPSPARLTLTNADEPKAVARDPLLDRIADLRSHEAARIRHVLGEMRNLEPALVPHLVPLVAYDEVSGDVQQALRRLAPRAVGQILDTVLDPAADPVLRRRLPRLFRASADPRVVDGLLRGLHDPIFAVRASCGATLASMAARSRGLHVEAAPVFAAVLRELGSSRARDPAVLRHAFALLSIVLEPEPLRAAEAALGSSDVGLEGTALEYLENVLPNDVNTAFQRFVGAPGAPRTRAPEELRSALLAAREGPRRPRGGAARAAIRPRD